MTRRNDFDRTMSAYLETRSTSRVPDGLLDAALAGVDATRQRPGWLVPERWLGGQAGRVARLRTVTALVAIVALLVGALIGLGILVGSQRRLPQPFGIAKPGLVAYDLRGAIYVVNPDGTERRQLTSGSAPDDSATFSPDGTRIAFYSDVGDGYALRVVSADGGTPTIIARQLADPVGITWAPDSRRVAFSARMSDTPGLHVFVADADREHVTPFGGPEIVGIEPSWSPDGKVIAFKRLDDVGAGVFGAGALWLIDTDGSHPRQLSTTAEAPNLAYWNTAWSPDGTRIAFLAPSAAGNYDVFVVNADGSGQRDISNSPEDEAWPSWSPDGTRIAFARMSSKVTNQGSVVIADPDGTHSVVFGGPSVNSDVLIWSPDGTQLIGYAKNPDPSQDYNVAIAVFDPTGRASPMLIPADRFGGASWQRLAP